MFELPVIAIRFALYADLMVLTGLVAFPLYALTADERASGLLRLRMPVAALCAGGLLLSAFGMAVLIASMTGSSLAELDGEAARSIIFESTIGTAWIVRVVALLAALILGTMPDQSRRSTLAGLVLCGAVALATLVWTGHAGATEGWLGTIHRASDIVHMLAAAVWIGAIAVFCLLLFGSSKRLSAGNMGTLHRCLEQFSQVGTIAVGLIVATGIVNCLAVIGFPHFARLPLTEYGRLLIIKLLLFAAMLLFAAFNRWRLTPALGSAIGNGSPAEGVVALRRSLLMEGGIALVILALVAWLGTLEPQGAM